MKQVGSDLSVHHVSLPRCARALDCGTDVCYRPHGVAPTDPIPQLPAARDRQSKQRRPCSVLHCSAAVARSASACMAVCCRRPSGRTVVGAVGVAQHGEDPDGSTRDKAACPEAGLCAPWRSTCRDVGPGGRTGCPQQAHRSLEKSVGATRTHEERAPLMTASLRQGSAWFSAVFHVFVSRRARARANESAAEPRSDSSSKGVHIHARRHRSTWSSILASSVCVCAPTQRSN